MNAASFQVALTGLQDGHAAEDVAQRLAQMFRQPQEKMLSILDGQRRILKKGLSEDEARKYEAALQRAGCQCAVSADAAATAATPPASRTSDHATGPAAFSAAPSAATSAASTAAPAATAAAQGAASVPPVAAESSGRNFYANAAPAHGARHGAASHVPSPSAMPAAATRSHTSAAPASPAESTEDYRDRQSRRALYDMGAGQKFVIISIILNGAALGLSRQLAPLPELVASLAVAAVMIAGLLKLTRGLGHGTPTRVLLILLMLVPLVNLVTLVILSMKASKALKEEGIRVGLVGASGDDLATLATDAGLPPGTRPQIMAASIAVLLAFAACFAVSSHYREKAEQELALAMSQPCELAGVWDVSSRLGDFTLTLNENGKMRSSEGKTGDWHIEAGELLLTEDASTTHYKILRATDGYVLERMGVAHTMLPKAPLPGKRCTT